MRFMERAQFIFVAVVLVLTLFLGQGACDSTCPNGITNITAKSGTFSYPESGDYGINVTKCWMIEVPEPYQGIGFSYSRFEIEECKDCECDHVQYTNSYNTLKFVKKNCGRVSARHLEFLRLSLASLADGVPGRNLYIRFVSDDNVHHNGFSFEYVAASTTGGSESHLNASEDETIEFGTPKVGIQNYPQNYEHTWFLYGNEGSQIQIDFDIFELEQSKYCKNDYLEIREAYYYMDGGEIKVGGNYGPILSGYMCGSTKPSSFQSAGNMVWVHFKSDNNATTVYKGFKASFKAVGHAGKLSVSNPLTLLFLSALLMVASKNSVF